MLHRSPSTIGAASRRNLNLRLITAARAEQLGELTIMISREQPTIAVEDTSRAYAARDAALFQSLDGARWVRAVVLRTRSGPPVLKWRWIAILTHGPNAYPPRGRTVVLRIDRVRSDLL
jgi:hypothetical protein